MSDGHERKDHIDERDRSKVPGLTAAILAAVLVLGACAQPDTAEPTGSVDRAGFDSLLADLAGPQAENLSNGQRWRLVASTGTGLPPTSYRLADLPEPEARGASLQQVYCVQCHGVASPKMHTAAEWPILLRRMHMRTRTLRDRLAGERVEGAVDEMLMAGLQSANIPTAEDRTRCSPTFRGMLYRPPHRARSGMVQRTCCTWSTAPCATRPHRARHMDPKEHRRSSTG